MKTAVVILNWNTEALLKRFLPGLLASCEGKADVIVADNGSTDGSAVMVKTVFPEVKLIELGENLGFTGGYNKALGDLDGYEYYVLLNSDIDVDKDWLDPLVAWMDTHPECGVCGPKLLALDDDFSRSCRFEYAGAAGGCLDRFGYPFCRGRVLKRTESDCGQYDKAAEVLWVSGAALMTRASLWDTLCGLDGRFFAHMEEIDYCWRAALRGWSVFVVPESRVWHLGGGTLQQDSPFKLKLNFRNNLLMLSNNLDKTIGPRRAGFRMFVRMVFDGGAALAYLLSGRKDYFRSVLEAHKEYRILKSSKSGPRYSKSLKRIDKSLRSNIPGFYDICIIPQALLRGERIFDYLRKRYENNH